MPGSTIIAWGAALPKYVLTNADLESRLATTDKWIVERTGIHERRVGGTTTDLAVEAAREARLRLLGPYGQIGSDTGDRIGCAPLDPPAPGR